MKIILIVALLLIGEIVKGQDNSWLFQNVRIVDVNKGSISKSTNLLVENGKIKEIGPKAGKRFTGERKNMKGAYVLPGLINAHMHLGNDPQESPEHRKSVLEYLLRNGITSIRDAAGDARILKNLQQQVLQGNIEGPDIYYSAFIAGPAYYKGNDREKNMVIGLDSSYAAWLQCIRPGDNLQEAMKAAKDCGATGIKIYGGFNREELFPLIAAAREEGLEIWGHATLFPAKPTDVADAGMHVISHAYMLEWEGVEDILSSDIFKNYELYYSGIDHEHLDISRFIAAVKKQHTIFDPTLYLCMVNDMKWSARLVKEAHQAGVKICAGTDYIEDLKRPYPYLLDEIGMYVEVCGFRPFDAIRTATLIAAEALGQENEIGSVERGKWADLLILDNNPLEDIENLKTIKMVVKKGKIIEHGLIK